MHPLSLTHSHTLDLTSTHAHTHTRTHTCETRDGHEKQILLLESRLLEEGQKNCLDFIVTHLVPHTALKCLKSQLYSPSLVVSDLKSSIRRKLGVGVTYGVATVSRIDKIIGLFCRILSLL